MKIQRMTLYSVHGFSPQIFTNWHEKKKSLEGWEFRGLRESWEGGDSLEGWEG